jgi:hypothetical protein
LVHEIVIASEAKQSIVPRSKVWIASSLALLAMTAEALSRSFAMSRRDAPELCKPP